MSAQELLTTMLYPFSIDWEHEPARIAENLLCASSCARHKSNKIVLKTITSGPQNIYLNGRKEYTHEHSIVCVGGDRK